MSGGVANSERILRVRSIIKEGINFWEEGVQRDVDIESILTEKTLQMIITFLLLSGDCCKHFYAIPFAFWI